MEASGEQHGHQKGHPGAGGGKSRADLYAGAVAQRALYGPSQSRCRSGGGGGGQRRAAGGKDSKPPSRLSKMSGAEGT